MKAGQRKKGQIQIEINISVGLETARQVTQLHRSPHLDKASCTRTSKARYFSYGAAGQVLSWIKAKSRLYSKPQHLQGTEESVSSLSAHALVLQLAQVPHRTQTLLFQPVLRTSSIFSSCLQCYLSSFSCLIFMLSLDWCVHKGSEEGTLSSKKIAAWGDAAEHLSMARCYTATAALASGLNLHTFSNLVTWNTRESHSLQQDSSCKSLQTVSSIGAWSLRTQKSVWLPLKK